MSTDTLAPDVEKAILGRAIDAFATWLEKDAVLWDAATPVVHPMNQGVDGHSGKIGGVNSETLFLKVLSKDQERWARLETSVKMAKRWRKTPQLPGFRRN